MHYFDENILVEKISEQTLLIHLAINTGFELLI